MNDPSEFPVVRAYIATLHMPVFGKNAWAYGLLFHGPRNQSWHWGVKNREDQWVDMEMFGLRRVLQAVSAQWPDQEFRVSAFMRGAHLAQRLAGAAKTKRDIERITRDKTKDDEEKEQAIAALGLRRNRDAWIETATLWDIHKQSMREVIGDEEIRYLDLCAENLKRLYWKIPSPLKTHLLFMESPDELVF